MSEEVLLQKSASTLQRWSSYGRQFSIQEVASWIPLRGMIEATAKLLSLEKEGFTDLLKKSSEKLAPLEDPLYVDLGAHRWLSDKREEHYSDWLQWVAEQLKEPELVFRLFKINISKDILAKCRACEVSIEREVPLLKGYEGQTGRIDLFIRYPGAAIIAVEVKKTDAESADTEKQRGYIESLSSQYPEEKTEAILLITNSEESDSHGFTPLKWADVCLELRRIVPNLQPQGGLVAKAMILSFVGAVEQNLLGFSIYTHTSIFNSEAVNHIEKFLKEENENG